MKPLVSVVIPAYNASGFIEASIESALTQSFRDLEVIVVNDGSTDDTSERLSAWKDPRLRVIEQSNRGLAAALNTAVCASRGAFIGFLDADDIWLPQKLDHHLQLHRERSDIDVTFSWVRVIDGRGRHARMPCPRWRGTMSFPQLLSDYAIRTLSSVVMRREAAERAGVFNSRLVRCIDFEFFLRVSLLRPNNICAIEEVLSLYRRHSAQRTRDWRLMQKGWDQTLSSIRLQAPGETARVEKLAASNMHRYLASVAYEDGSFQDAHRLIRQSFSLAPTQFLRDARNWKMVAAALAGLTLPKRALLVLERAAGFDRPEE
jgi:glycosyltransferase involved in cell wall biosynthesis